MKRLPVSLLVLALLLQTLAREEEKELRVYHASVLRPGPNAETVATEQRARLFAEHQAYRRALYEAGELLMYGPTDGDPDRTIRGVSVFRGDRPIDEVRRLVAEDPYVRAGVMEGEVFVWLTVTPKLDQGFGIRRVGVPQPASPSGTFLTRALISSCTEPNRRAAAPARRPRGGG